jgi:hypothetical protein
MINNHIEHNQVRMPRKRKYGALNYSKYAHLN